MATIKKGKHAQVEDRLLLAQAIVIEKQLTLRLWDTKMERMEYLTFSREETERIDGMLMKSDTNNK